MDELKERSEPCLLCGQEDLSQSEMSSHMTQVHMAETVSCPICNFRGIDHHAINHHVNSAHPDPTCQTSRLSNSAQAATSPQQWSSNSDTSSVQENNLYTCPMCNDFKSDSMEALNVHVDFVHLHASSTNSPAVLNSDSKHATCHTICDDYLTSNNKENEPMTASSSDVGKIRCSHPVMDTSLCGTAQASCDVIREVTQASGCLFCPVCDAEMDNESSLSKHVFAKHPEISNLFQDDTELLCPICNEYSANSTSLQEHVNTHFTEDKKQPQLTDDSQVAQELDRRQREKLKFLEHKKDSASGVKNQKASRGRGRGRSSTNVSSNAALSRNQSSMLDFYARESSTAQPLANVSVDDGFTSTPGIMEMLQSYYSKPNKLVAIQYVAAATDHYSGSQADRGWGCGYRNFQMLLSCLLRRDEYKQVVFNGRPVMPSIAKLQRLIEEAWENGYDPQGREQLRGRLCGTQKWIGATEIFAALSSLKVKCQLVDFYRSTGPDGTHPKLFEWVMHYFQDGGFKPPLYFQHQGHSRTIVGVEQGVDGSYKLLIFDPGTPRSQMQQFVRKEITPQLLRSIRRPMNSIKAKQYQILAVRGLLSSQEQPEYKLVRSERIP